MADILQKVKTCREFLCGECEYDELRLEKGETVCTLQLLDDVEKALERKKGEWEYKPSLYPYGVEHFECSLCGESVVDRTNFCPNCGAEMREET